MASLCGRHLGVYKITDFRQRGNPTQYFEADDQCLFKEELANKVKNGVIQKFSVFESKLDGVPVALMHLIKRPGMRLCHEYVDMQIKDYETDETFFVSLEMGQREILAQISNEEEDVTEWRMNKYFDKKETRREVHLIHHLDMTDIKFLVSKTAVSIFDFLDLDEETFSIVPRYHLIQRNCQLFVRDVRSRLDLLQCSKEIKFWLPGSGGAKVTIDDPIVVEQLTHRSEERL